MKKQKPSDVIVTDELRNWSVSRGWPMHLPDVFIQDFHDRSEASGKTYANAEKAFQNQITWSSPGQRFYSAQEWEGKVRAAKARERTPKRTSTQPSTVAGILINPGQQTVAIRSVALAALAAARGAIK